MDVKVGPLVAQGNTSNVYRCGRDAVAKVLRPGIPDHWAVQEAETTELVHAAGLPAPRVLDMSTVGGRPAIVLERIDGVSMWVEMRERQGDISRLSRTLADLQAEVNATPAPTGLVNLADRLRAKIQNARSLSDSECVAALAELDARPQCEALCHFDVHPNNVIMGARGPVLIDWFDAAVGCPAADVVRSSVLMRPVAAMAYLECPDSSLIGAVHDEYLGWVLRDRPAVAGRLLGWERSVLASRLAEPLSEPIQLDTLAELRLSWAARPTRLAESVSCAGVSRSASSGGSARRPLIQLDL